MAALPQIDADLGFSPTGLSWAAERLHAHVRRAAAARRARRATCSGRRRIFMLGSAMFTAASLAVGLAPSPAWMIARPRHAGHRRRRARPRDARAAVGELPRRAGADAGDGRVRRARRCRHRGRAAARRRADHHPVLALRVPAQRPRRHRGDHRRPARARRDGAARRARWMSRARCARRSAPPRWCSASCTPPTSAGRRRRRSPPSAWASCCSPASSPTRPGRRSRCSRCGCSRTAAAPARTAPGSSSTERWSASSSS